MIDRQRIHLRIQGSALIYHTKSQSILAALHAFPIVQPLDSRRANC